MLYISLLCLSTALIALVLARDARRNGALGLPPGPGGIPFFGNALQLPSSFLWVKLAAWSKHHGSIYTIWMMGKPFVVLNSISVSADILDRHSGLTADRFHTIKGGFYGTENTLGVMDHTPQWRAHRRAIHANMNIRATARFMDLQAAECAKLALSLLQHPEISFHDQIHRTTGSMIFRALYGGESFPVLGEDPSRKMDRLLEELLHSLLPSNSIVDMLPLLKPVIQRVKCLRHNADSWQRRMALEGRQLFDSATSKSGSLASDLNVNLDKYGISKTEGSWIGAALYLGGKETTHTALRIFALAVLHHPETMKAAQEQLDDVCGDRPPRFADRTKLPYIEALVKETLRWRPGAPMSLVHVASEDFQYNGYRFARGTAFLDNIWAQMRDSAVFLNPEAFDPTRYLDSAGALLPVVPGTRSDLMAFGRGRRVCPGKDFALNSMFIACSSLLWAFTFQWKKDRLGNDLVCGCDDFEDHAFVTTPMPFDFVLRARQPDLEEKLLEVLKLEPNGR